MSVTIHITQPVSSGLRAAQIDLQPGYDAQLSFVQSSPFLASTLILIPSSKSIIAFVSALANLISLNSTEHIASTSSAPYTLAVSQQATIQNVQAVITPLEALASFLAPTYEIAVFPSSLTATTQVLSGNWALVIDTMPITIGLNPPVAGASWQPAQPTSLAVQIHTPILQIQHIQPSYLGSNISIPAHAPEGIILASQQSLISNLNNISDIKIDFSAPATFAAQTLQSPTGTVVPAIPIPDILQVQFNSTEQEVAKPAPIETLNVLPSTANYYDIVAQPASFSVMTNINPSIPELHVLTPVSLTEMLVNGPNLAVGFIPPASVDSTAYLYTPAAGIIKVPPIVVSSIPIETSIFEVLVSPLELIDRLYLPAVTAQKISSFDRGTPYIRLTIHPIRTKFHIHLTIDSQPHVRLVIHPIKTRFDISLRIG